MTPVFHKRQMADCWHDTGTTCCETYAAECYGIKLVQANHYLDAMCIWIDAGYGTDMEEK